MISIAYLASHYPSTSHTFMLNEVLALRRLGLDVRVVSVNESERPEARLTAAERDELSRTWYLKRAARTLRPHLRQAAHPWRYLSALVGALRMGRTDIERLVWHLFYFHEAVVLVDQMETWGVQHVHVQFAMAAAAVGTLASRLGKTMSIAVHGPDDFYDVTFYRLEEKFRSASFITTIGEYARSQVCRLLPAARWKDVIVSPLGVDLRRFVPVARPAPGVFRILCVGRLVPAKGQLVLVAAARALRQQGHAVHLTLVGDGPNRAAIEREMGADDVLTGALNPDEVLRAYEQAHAFVLPTFAEGIPVVLMEAMAMQLPCVSTWVNGIPELITHDIDGLLVAPANVVALTASLLRLIEDPELGTRLGEAARRTVMQRYNLDENSARMARTLTQRLA